MEGLNAVMKSAVEANLFKGIRLPNNGPEISHVMYADDVMFLGDWCVRDTINLARLLRCFHLSSGLRVNFGKSKVFGVGVTDHEVGSMAEIIHCGSTSLPVTFLGLPVGANMGLSRHWDQIIEKVKWFALKDLFPGLYALELHKGCLVSDRVLTISAELVDTVWNWSRSRLSAEIVSDIADLELMVVSYKFHTGKADTWRWIGDSSGKFSVQRLRGFMAEALYGIGWVSNDFWDRWLPIKVNCFIWRLMKYRIPVAVNLISRGMVSVSPECHTCVSVYE
ncbi:uncharacterized protein LOC143591643 [Bidens hawaiensis]|uniref:uncharacterized protein LOC143591643 n=1 Tax=Bidens hawaiensis TaxID=980011 RepID=UPI00404AFB18